LTTEGQAVHHETENVAKKLDDVSPFRVSTTNSTKTESIILPAIAPVRKEREAKAAPHVTTVKAQTRKAREATVKPHEATKSPTRKAREATVKPQEASKIPTQKATATPHITTTKATVKH
jgi:hypothetical protein